MTRLLRPHLLAYLPALLVPWLLGYGWLTAVVVCLVVAATADDWLEGRTKHLAGLVFAILASIYALFLRGAGAGPAALLMLVPAAALLGAARIWGEDRVRGAVGRVPLLTVLLYALPVAGLHLAAGLPSPVVVDRGVPSPADDFLFAVRDNAVPAPLSEAERVAAVATVRAALTGEAPPPPAGRLAEPPEGRVFVTLFRESRRHHVARGQSQDADTLAAALTDAAKTAWAEAPSRRSWTTTKAKILIDLAGEEQLLRPSLARLWARGGLAKLNDALGWRAVRWDPIVYDAEPGLDSFALTHGDKEAVVLGGDLLIHSWVSPRSLKKRWRLDNLDAVWKRLMSRAGLPDSPAGSVAVTNFRTYQFAEPVPGSGRTVELFRMNTRLPGSLDEAALLDGIDRVGKWLLGTVEDSGKFDYEYFPSQDRHGSGYNEVRHAGSVYGLFHMAHVAKSEPTLAADYEAYVEAGVKAMDRVYRNLGTPPGKEPSEGFITFLEGKRGKKSNSGSPALTLLAFLERPAPSDVSDPALSARLLRPGDDALARGLAKTLVAMIDDDGKVYRYWRNAIKGEGVKREPPYFPGEAMLALVKYHEHTGEAEWLEAARAIGRRQIPFAARPGVTPDHWVMQALDVLDRLEPDNDEWARGAYAMGRRYMKEQFQGPLGMPSGLGPVTTQRRPALVPPFPDYEGAWRRVQEVPRTTRAASRGEAIGGVARIAWRRGDPAGAWERSLLEGARHLLEQTFTEDNSFYFPNPTEGLGAIRMGIVDNHCRIDNNQHGIVGLNNALAALRRRESSP